MIGAVRKFREDLADALEDAQELRRDLVELAEVGAAFQSARVGDPTPAGSPTEVDLRSEGWREVSPGVWAR